MDVAVAALPPATLLLAVQCAVVLVLLLRLSAAAKHHCRPRASERSVQLEPLALLAASAGAGNSSSAALAEREDCTSSALAGACADKEPAAPPPPESELLECAGLLDGLFGERPGFELVIEQAQLRFLRKQLSPCASQFLTEGVAPCTAAEFLRLWTDTAFRHEWDSGLLSLAPLPGGGGALCHVIKYPFPLASRHYVYDRHVRTLPDGTTVIICTSAAARLATLGVCTGVRGSVLCATFHSATALRPATDGSGGCEYAMLTLDQQPVRLPSWLLDSLLQRTYPAYMASVAKAISALVAQRPLRSAGCGSAAGSNADGSSSGGSARGSSDAGGGESSDEPALAPHGLPLTSRSPPPVPARARARASQAAAAAAAAPAPAGAAAVALAPRAAAIVARGASTFLRSLGLGAAGAPLSISVAS